MDKTRGIEGKLETRLEECYDSVFDISVEAEKPNTFKWFLNSAYFSEQSDERRLNYFNYGEVLSCVIGEHSVRFKDILGKFTI